MPKSDPLYAYVESVKYNDFGTPSQITLTLRITKTEMQDIKKCEKTIAKYKELVQERAEILKEKEAQLAESDALGPDSGKSKSEITKYYDQLLFDVTVDMHKLMSKKTEADSKISDITFNKAQVTYTPKAKGKSDVPETVKQGALLSADEVKALLKSWHAPASIPNAKNATLQQVTH